MSRSRWLIVIAFLLAALVCVRLGFWQLARLRERRVENASAQAARSAPIVQLTGEAMDSNLVNRRIRAVGRYDHAHDIVLRGQVYRGVPGVEIVTPLVLEGALNTAVLVNRGFVPAPDAVTVDPTVVQERETRQVEGIAIPLDTAGGAPLRRGSTVTWARLERGTLEARLPYRVYPFYIQQAPDSARSFPRRLDAPALNDGPHLNYAIQWFAFAGLAVIFAGIMASLKRRDRPAPL
jgi:surfeit locus 1 family protein